MAGLHREKMAESMQNTCRSCSGLEQHCSIIYNFTFDQDLCDFVNSSFNTKKKKALVSWKHLFDLTATEISPEIRINLDLPAKIRIFCMQSELLHTITFIQDRIQIEMQQSHVCYLQTFNSKQKLGGHTLVMKSTRVFCWCRTTG